MNDPPRRFAIMHVRQPKPDLLLHTAVCNRTGARRIPGGGDSRSTKDLVLHEIAHAVDFNLHGATEANRLSEGRAFRDAVALDAPKIQSEYVAMGHSEIFAEYMARFMRQPEKVRQECPHLYAYFHTLIHRVPKP